MMENRPDKPGSYWAEFSDGYTVVVKVIIVTDDYISFLAPGIGDTLLDTKFGGLKWIGPAHPPKRVQRYEWADRGMEMVNGSDYVGYEDVKEYLID